MRSMTDEGCRAGLDVLFGRMDFGTQRLNRLIRPAPRGPFSRCAGEGGRDTEEILADP